ncbi:MAG TPA: hypothetical protein VMT51_11110 [Dongiaceae bacterium]|nr:hypothetical protein [Dongiaceae bacterium]
MTCKETLRYFLPAALALAGVSLAGCGLQLGSRKPGIEITKVPEARTGGPEATTTIEGRASGAENNDRVVIYAHSGQWWVQPLAESPFTQIHPEGTWSSSTHFGNEYAALLVEGDYRPAPTVAVLPVTGGPVKAVTVATGAPSTVASKPKSIHFSGYEWNVRNIPSNRGGTSAPYSDENAWTDDSGALHLKVSRIGEKWNDAEVNLTRSLGYGSYRFVIRESAHLEPALVLGLFTWDDTGPEQNHREFGVELARWGDPQNKNSQFVVQPYYVPANVARFGSPAGPMTYLVRWEPDKLHFEAFQGRDTKPAHRISEHTFASGVPTPGNELVHMNLYIFYDSAVPLSKETEAVIEKFEYLP